MSVAGASGWSGNASGSHVLGEDQVCQPTSSKREVVGRWAWSSRDRPGLGAQTWGLAGFSNPRVDGPPRNEVGRREKPGPWVGAVRDADLRSLGSWHTKLHKRAKAHEAMKGGPGPRWRVAGVTCLFPPLSLGLPDGRALPFASGSPALVPVWPRGCIQNKWTDGWMSG